MVGKLGKPKQFYVVLRDGDAWVTRSPWRYHAATVVSGYFQPHTTHSQAAKALREKVTARFSPAKTCQESQSND